MADKEPIRIGVEEAKELLDDGDAFVLDVVDTGVYDRVPERIEGAVRIDPTEVPDEYERLPDAGTVLTYCT